MIVLHVLVYLLEGFPLVLVLVGVACHMCYGSLLTTFPIISLCSMGFMGGTGNLMGGASGWSLDAIKGTMNSIIIIAI